jgi:Cu-Zn family superoxide dismutase
MNATRIGHLLQIAVVVVLAAAAGGSAGCAGEAPPPVTKASAALASRSGSTVTGMANFEVSGAKVNLTLTVSGGIAGNHGVHLHAVGDCSAADAASAMGHWNPDMMNHGLPTAAPHHLGDCGNFTIAADGTGTLTFSGDWSIGTGNANDIIGKAIIVHANPDDGVTQTPPGNAGARVACGVVAL